MPATSCSMAIPKFWPPVEPNSNSRNSKVSSTWWPDADFPSAPNAARFRGRCGVAATVFPSDEGRKTKWHWALLPAAPTILSVLGGKVRRSGSARHSAFVSFHRRRLPHIYPAGQAFAWVDRHLDSMRHGPAHLRQETIAQIVVDSIRQGAELGH